MKNIFSKNDTFGPTLPPSREVLVNSDDTDEVPTDEEGQKEDEKVEKKKKVEIKRKVKTVLVDTENNQIEASKRSEKDILEDKLKQVFN